MATQGKDHSPNVVVFDTLFVLPFDAVTLSASLANTTILATQALPTNYKCIGVSVNLAGSPAGTISFNVVCGPGVEGGVGTKDTVATNGTQMFTADQALTVTANTPQLFIPTVWDVIYPNSQPLTLRAVTNGSGAGILKVTLFGKILDAQIQKGFLAVNGQPTY